MERTPERTIGSTGLHLCDCMDLLASMPDGSVDIVLTDPPYMYLDHRLDRPFDIERVFGELHRVLKKERSAMIVFGRGPSFYRTGTVLEGLGLRFLEEAVWHKARRSSPVTPLGRVHESVSIWGMGTAKINRVRVPLPKKYAFDPGRSQAMLHRVCAALGHPQKLAEMERWLASGLMPHSPPAVADGLTVRGRHRKPSRAATDLRALLEGGTEESVISVFRDDCYAPLHPTQKPVALLKRLLALVLPMDRPPEEVTVLDPFGGSFSTMAATMELGMRGISCEIDPGYFGAGAERIAGPEREHGHP